MKVLLVISFLIFDAKAWYISRSEIAEQDSPTIRQHEPQRLNHEALERLMLLGQRPVIDDISYSIQQLSHKLGPSPQFQPELSSGSSQGDEIRPNVYHFRVQKK